MKKSFGLLVLMCLLLGGCTQKDPEEEAKDLDRMVQAVPDSVNEAPLSQERGISLESQSSER